MCLAWTHCPSPTWPMAEAKSVHVQRFSEDYTCHLWTTTIVTLLALAMEIPLLQDTACNKYVLHYLCSGEGSLEMGHSHPHRDKHSSHLCPHTQLLTHAIHTFTFIDICNNNIKDKLQRSAHILRVMYKIAISAICATANILSHSLIVWKSNNFSINKSHTFPKSCICQLLVHYIMGDCYKIESRLTVTWWLSASPSSIGGALATAVSCEDVARALAGVGGLRTQ